MNSGSEPLAYRKKAQIEGFSAGIEGILGGALEATSDSGKERFSVDGVVRMVGDNESCERDMVRDL